MFHKCFRGVSEKFHVFLRVFQCSSVFDSMFTRSYNVFQWCFKEFSKKIQGVSEKFQVAWHSSQLPEQKEGLFLVRTTHSEHGSKK